jgi:hypothetical protein
LQSLEFYLEQQNQKNREGTSQEAERGEVFGKCEKQGIRGVKWTNTSPSIAIFSELASILGVERP